MPFVGQASHTYIHKPQTLTLLVARIGGSSAVGPATLALALYQIAVTPSPNQAFPASLVLTANDLPTDLPLYCPCSVVTVDSRPFTMPSLGVQAVIRSHTSIHDLMIAAVWQVLYETPDDQKDPAFAMIFPSLDSIAKLWKQASSIGFAPGLLGALQSPTPPTSAVWLSLPSARLYKKPVFMAYMLLLVKESQQDRIYGGETCSFGGHKVRVSHYIDRTMLPGQVRQSLAEGFRIVHIGMLAWVDVPPTASSFASELRLLFYAVEATLSFFF